MDLERLLAELIEERSLIDGAIASLERLLAKAGKRTPGRRTERAEPQKNEHEQTKAAARADSDQ